MALAKISRMMLSWVDRADITFVTTLDKKHSVLHPSSANSRQKQTRGCFPLGEEKVYIGAKISE